MVRGSTATGGGRPAFGILGSLEVHGPQELITLPGARQRIVLAALLLRPNRAVAVDELVDALWAEQPPATARDQVVNVVYALRRLLGRAGAADRLVTQPPGYLLRVEPDELDLTRFELLAAAADEQLAGWRADTAARTLREALRLWRGPALADVPAPFAAVEARRLAELHLATTEKLVDVEFGLDRHRAMVPELTRLVNDHPLRERLRARLMLALYHAGRKADALATYRAGRRLMVDELGLEPGPELRALERAMLTGAVAEPLDRPAPPRIAPAVAGNVVRLPGHAGSGPAATLREQLAAGPAPAGLHTPPTASGQSGADPARRSGPGAAPPSGADPDRRPGPPAAPLSDAEAVRQPGAGPAAHTGRPASPAQLPRDIADFTGRRAEVDEIGRLLREAADATAVPVIVVGGAPGVGKTALVTHAAHLARSRFPDGQLHAELGPGREPAEVLARMLDTLGATAVPTRLDERSRLLRSLLAGRRMLLVFDDVADVSQLRPLLPGEAGCAVLATSRRELVGLEGAHRVRLDVLDEAAAVDLLAATAGRARAAAEPDAARRLAALCGRSPLALRIAGARIALRPDWTLHGFAQRLADPERRLDELRAGDLDVRAGLAAALAGLGAADLVAARRLAQLDAPDFPMWTAAATLSVSPAEAEELIDRLVQRHLVGYAGADALDQPRYRFPELLRLHLRERGRARQPPVLAAV